MFKKIFLSCMMVAVLNSNLFCMEGERPERQINRPNKCMVIRSKIANGIRIVRTGINLTTCLAGLSLLGYGISKVAPTVVKDIINKDYADLTIIALGSGVAVGIVSGVGAVIFKVSDGLLGTLGDIINPDKKK